MHYVYLLRSVPVPKQRYTGLTSDLQRRVRVRNAGRCTHTSKYAPWTLEAYLAFSTREQAVSFKRYLKTGSGLAFANKRLWAR
ncbi:MAG: putative GIY-YIG superfamily endonuclease [Maricaulis maris]|jgi:putative endonuclease